MVIVEYADFQCPVCRLGAQAVKGVYNRYPDKIRVIFRHNPLIKLHPWAKLAAQAAECAGRRGKFWEFQDTLFIHQAAWTQSSDARSVFVSYAEQLGLSARPFRACLDAPETQNLVEADSRESARRSIPSAPVFFINENRCVGIHQLLAVGLPAIRRSLADEKR